jgi:hypothetical protein
MYWSVNCLRVRPADLPTTSSCPVVRFDRSSGSTLTHHARDTSYPQKHQTPGKVPRSLVSPGFLLYTNCPFSPQPWL